MESHQLAQDNILEQTPKTLESSIPSTTDVVVNHAAVLSAVEIGLGSLLHGLKIPMGGHFLSLNQGFFLCRGILSSGSHMLPVTVSNITAVMKSLSPAGKRLTPMLAISSQGLCFAIGPILLGINYFGLSLGMILLSLWGFLQPAAILYLLFGSPLVQALSKLAPGNTPWIIAGALVAGKILLAIAVVVLAKHSPESLVSRYQERMLKLGAHRRRRSTVCSAAPTSFHQHARLAMRELLHPLFIFSLVLTMVFFIWVDSSVSTMIWGLLRPLAGGFLLFFLFRLIPWEKQKWGALMSQVIAKWKDL